MIVRCGAVVLAAIALSFAVDGGSYAASGCKRSAAEARFGKSDCQPEQRRRTTAPRDGACAATQFYTQLVQNACERGGQAAANKAMKQFLVDARRRQPGLDCQSCHTRLAPDYPLTPGGLALFKRLSAR